MYTQNSELEEMMRGMSIQHRNTQYGVFRFDGIIDYRLEINGKLKPPARPM